MNRRMLALCLHAYSPTTRQRDGDYLRDLALDLADRQGSWVQVRTLLGHGVVDRVSSVNASRAALVRVATLTTLGLAFAGVTLVAGHGTARDEVVSYSCSVVSGDRCAAGRAQLAEHLRSGWSCSEPPGPERRVAVRWTCTISA